MKRAMRQIACLILALCLLVSLVPVAGATEEKTTVDFVLVLDCSGTMRRNDPKELAALACKLFVANIPIQDARVSVITFGYGGGGYDFHSFDVTYDKNLIHQITPLTGEMTLEQMADLKNKIGAAAKKDGENTPVGQALAAAVDTLIAGGSTDGNACVILLSDGGLSSPIAYQESINLVDAASKKAGEHEWPIFCIELDYKNSNEGATKENRQRLNRICELSGSGKDSRMKVNDPAGVWKALWTVFERFMDPVKTDVVDMVIGQDGTVETTITIPELTSETNVVIYGDGVTAVELTNKAQNTSVMFTDSKADKKFIADRDSEYFAVKIICPEAGEWGVKVFGNKDAQIENYSYSIQEMALDIVATPDGSTMLTKNDTIKIQSFFTYNGVDVTNNSFYEQNAASLVVTSAGGVKQEFSMEGATNGYHYELPVSAVPSGAFSVQVVLKHTMFRDGAKVSDVITFKSENMPVTVKEDAAPVTLDGNVNNNFQNLDLTQFFNNPDNDALEYTLSCTSDVTKNFVYGFAESNADVMQIAAGMAPGTYTMRIGAKDSEMQDFVYFDGLTLTVENNGIEQIKPIEKQKVEVDFCDSFLNILVKQQAEDTLLNLDLNAYFVDPDGVPLSYGEVTVSEAGLVDAAIVDDHVLHVEAIAEGEVTLKTTIFDGVETIETQIEVSVVDPWGEYCRENRPRWLAVGLAILALLLFRGYVKTHTYMKGSWMITITKDFNSITTGVETPAKNRNVVRKAKDKPFSMVDLVNESLPFMDNQGNLQTNCVEFLSTDDAKAIKFKGVFGKLGFMVMDVPTNGNVEVEYNGALKTNVKKFRVKGGELRITIKREKREGDVNLGIEEKLSIYFKNSGR